MIISRTCVGSRVTCNPPPQDTDNDILILVKEGTLKENLEYFLGLGYKLSTDYPGDIFTSMRRDEDNLIVTDDKGFHDKFLVATSLAKRFNLLKKEDRVALFQGVLYGNNS